MQLGDYTRSTAATDDAAQHLSSITLARVGNGATLTLYAAVPTWDAVGYVTSVARALPMTTTTDYLAGGLAEQVVVGALTSYYAVAGVVTAVSVGSTLSYLASDGLGSVTAALSCYHRSVVERRTATAVGTVRRSMLHHRVGHGHRVPRLAAVTDMTT